MDDDNEFVQVPLLLTRRQKKQLDRLKQPLGVRSRMAVLRIAIDRLSDAFFVSTSPVERTDVGAAGSATQDDAPNP